MSLVIQFKQGARFTGSAEPAYHELEKIRKRDGNITPEAVYEAAKDGKSQLHRHIFDCNRDTAAKRYYLERGRNLVRSIEVHQVEKKPDDRLATAAYTNVTIGGPAKQRQVYDSTEELLKDPEMRAQVLANAIRDLSRLRKKYYALQELAKVYAAFDEVLLEFKA